MFNGGIDKYDGREVLVIVGSNIKDKTVWGTNKNFPEYYFTSLIWRIYKALSSCRISRKNLLTLLIQGFSRRKNGRARSVDTLLIHGPTCGTIFQGWAKQNLFNCNILQNGIAIAPSTMPFCKLIGNVPGVQL